MTESEQSKDQSVNANEVQSIDDFKNLSLEDMEKELKSKSVTPKTEAKVDQDQQNSETSEDDSETEQDTTQESEQSSEEEQSEQSEDSSESDNSDKQKEDKKSEKKFDFEKAYKELQSEFTRRSQELKELRAKLEEVTSRSEKSPENKGEDKQTKSSRLAQLRAKDPEAANFLEEIINEQVERKVQERVKPVEEQVTLRRRQENAQKFAKEIDSFKKSELAPMETELLEIWNSNPSYWQQVVWDSEDAFEQLRKELVYRHLDKVAELKNKKAKENTSSTEKKERLKDSQVATKTKVTQATKDVMSSEEFRRLPLSEMEKRLPKHRN